MFAENTADPQDFVKECDEQGCGTRVLEIGGSIQI